MTALPSFTVTGNLNDILGEIASGELLPTPLAASVRFTSNMPSDSFIGWGGALYRVDPVIARSTSDGITRNGSPVLLLANDAGLSVGNLQWQVEITFNPSADRVCQSMSFWFNAPADGATIDLATVAPVPGVGVSGVPFSAGELVTLLGNSGSSVRAALDALYTASGSTDEYHEYANFAGFPGTGVLDRLYLAKDTGKLYRWTGSAYLQIADKAAVGLGNVDNTSDANKPVSTAQAAADALKADILTPAAAIVTASTAPAIGLITLYNAASGNLTPPLPALSGIAVGRRLAVRRDPADASTNTVTFTTAGGDTFYSSGATTFTLPIAGEQREFQVIQPGGSGSKYWAPAGSLNPVSGLDARYLGLVQAAKNPDVLVTGAITVDGSDLMTSAAVIWPDSSVGTLTITSRDSNNAVLGYNVTYGSPVKKTFTQPTITRNTNGAATNVPAIVVT